MPPPRRFRLNLKLIRLEPNGCGVVESFSLPERGHLYSMCRRQSVCILPLLQERVDLSIECCWYLHKSHCLLNLISLERVWFKFHRFGK